MAFYTLQPMEPAFSSPISAFFKAFVMMLGEYQFEDYFTIEKVTLPTINLHGTILDQLNITFMTDV